MTGVTVIMPVKGEEGMTDLTLRSLRAHCGGLVGRVVVVDNSPDGATRRTLDALHWPAVERVEGAPGLTFSQACNRGAARADRGSLLFLNNDVESRAPWLGPLRELHRRTGALVSATLTYPDGRLQHAGEAMPVWGNPFILGDRGNADEARYAGVRRRWGAIAALLLIDREVFDDVGGFDEGYRFGLEDADLCMKGGQQGCPTLVKGMGGIVHHTSQTVATLTTADRAASVAANNRRFAERWGAFIGERQQEYCRRLRERGITRVTLAGAGSAAATAARVLTSHGLKLAGYLDDTGAILPDDAPTAPVVGYGEAASLKGGAILPASNALAAVEAKVAAAGLSPLLLDPELPGDGWTPGEERGLP
ncbi:MAG: glycosyltransferase [Nitrospinae bacterium]|nr:glycosyltransferase [Nitrospinota bacterium]